ncbi:MAG: branched-chain amino acid ABC transporter permease [Phycisphaerales bacterium]|nr:branched-chain amino acid ABC transporter permease [Phycisphaerales bacterium]
MKPLAEHIRAITPREAFRPVVMFVPWIVCVLVALGMHTLAPLVVDDYWVNVLRRIGVFIVAAVSLNIVNGFTGQFSMGHAGFMAIGAYIGGGVTYYGSLMLHGSVGDPSFQTHGVLLMLGGVAAAGCVAAGAGYVVGLPSLRLRGDYLAIVTLGFGEIIRVLLELTTKQLYTREEVTLGALFKLPLNGPTGFERIPGYASVFWIFLFASITCLIAYRVKQSSSGRAFLSIREDEIAARAMGVNLTKYKVRAFVLAAFFGGVAGALYAHTGVNPSPTDAGFQRSFDIIIMVVLGGLGSISGSVLAAIILIALPELLRDLQQYRLIVYALLLIIMMLVRPQGLFGVREIWDFFGKKNRPTSKEESNP